MAENPDKASALSGFFMPLTFLRVFSVLWYYNVIIFERTPLCLDY